MSSRIDVKREKELDSKDKAILYELSLNSAQNASEIAKKTGMSKQVVGYRIKELVKDVKCYSIIDKGKLGFSLFDILLTYDSVPDEKELLLHLDKDDKVVAYGPGTGCDLILRVWAKNNAEVKEIILKIDKRFNGFIADKEVMFVEKSRILGKKYLVEKHDEGFEFPGRGTEKVDKVDMKILGLLALDSRLTYSEIGKKTKLSTNAISHRMKSLKKMIAGSTVYADGEKTKIFFKSKSASSERVASFNSFLSRHKSIVVTESYVGAWDYGIEIEEGDVREIVLEIRKLFGDIVGKIKIVKIYDEGKHNYMPKEYE
ncbi:AsnC family transcriptional regulator [Nanoarchaeota archaeon]